MLRRSPQNKPKRNRKRKMQDLNANDVAGAMKMVVGSARSMGIEVVEVKIMTKLAKKQKPNALVDRTKLYSIEDAVKILIEAAKERKFSETIEIAIDLVLTHVRTIRLFAV